MMHIWYLPYGYTVDIKRFDGLSICGFSPMKFFAEILSRCVDHQCLLLKSSQENFLGTLKNCKNHESLAQ